MTTTPVLPSLPEITQDELEFLTYNPNTSDLVEWIQGYARRAIESLSRAPIDMVLHCPKCGGQHIDASEDADPLRSWDNPPHRSHQCHFCTTADGKPFVWRPADVPTNGVAAVKTKGKADSPIVSRAPAEPIALDEFCWLVELFDLADNSLAFYHTGFTPLGGSSRATRSPFEAKRYASKDAANLVASKLYSLAGVWRAAEHVFAAHPTESAGPDPAEVEADARRYRWLRENVNGGLGEAVHDDRGRDLLDGERLDQAIDAALGESHEG